MGSVLVPKLIEEGYDVTVLDNFMYDQASLNSCCHHHNFHVHNVDIRVEADVLPHLRKADVIIPLAAYVGAPLCKKDPIGATTTNKDAIFMMMKHLSKNQMVIMPTTNSAYGSGDENNYCTEESPLKPISKYAIDKVEVEKRLMDHPNAISYRLATVFGMAPRMRIDLLVNDFVYRAVNDRFIVLFESRFKRNFIHIRDVSRAFIHAIRNFQDMKNQIYNVGLSNANLSKWELCELIQKQLNYFIFNEATIGKDPDQRNYIVSNEKLEKTGFETFYDLDFGVKELITGYQMLNNRKYGNV